MALKAKYVIFIFIIVFSLIIPLQSFQYFKAYNLLSSDKIILITDEGIFAYDSQLNTNTPLLEESSLITTETDIKFIFFAQSSLDDGGLIFCRIKNYVYIYDESFTSHGNFQIDIEDICVLNPYRNKNGTNTLIVSYMNSSTKLKTIMYVLDLNNNENPISSFTEKDNIPLLNKNGEEKSAINQALSCQLMAISAFTNELLTCFAADEENRVMNAIVLNPENNLELVHYSSNIVQASEPLVIESVLNPNKKECMVCVIEIGNSLNCLTYNSEKNEFTDFISIFNDCLIIQYYMGINYISEKEEYSAFCGSYLGHLQVNFITLDKNYNIKSKDENSNECYYHFSLPADDIYNTKMYYLLYVKSFSDYKILRSHTSDNNDAFDLLTILENCNKEIDIVGLKPDNGDTLISSTSTPKTSTLSTSTTKVVTTIPTTFISSTSIIKETTTLISSTTIKKQATTIPTTSISPTSIIKELTTIVITSISSTSIMNETTTLPTTSISSTLSELTSPSTKLHQTIPKKLVSTQFQTILTSTIHSKISSFPSSKLISSLTSIPNMSLKSSAFFSSIPYNSINLYKNDLINFYNLDEDIIKGTISKTKEELEDNLKEIMDVIEIGKKYEINGNDYNLTITPINDLNTVKSTYIDFSDCEEILRKECHIPPEEILTILQIEIDKMNENALTNQVEYAVYNKNKEKLKLSYCKDVKITVNYEIKNQSVLNKTMIDYYSELGIDIFDIEDSFFNDICYPFSISDSDVILKDRVSDIYQNYSLCNNGCDYESIDIENMTVSCSCQIKEEISMEVSEPALSEIIEYTFKDSNIGVLRCYNLVFDFSNKINNYGFLIFLLLITFHIICYIIYFINRIKYVMDFVFREMEKNGYITRLNHPKKKKKR